MIIRNELLKTFMRLFYIKKLFGKLFVNPPRRKCVFDPDRFDSRRFTVIDNRIAGFRLLTLQPSGSEDHNNGHILFLHGGAYVLEAVKYHRVLAETFTEKYQFSCTFFDYPLAPENDFEKTNSLTLEAYRFIVSNFKDEKFFVFGDSAGGGLALVLIQQLRDLGIKPFPEKTVLQSPWVNLKMDNPDIKQFSDTDPLLDVKYLAAAAEHYVKGKTELDNPVVSPYFGKMNNLSSVFLLYGTDEILNPDCSLLAEKLRSADGTELRFEIGEGMIHDWVIMPIPESVQTIKNIADFYYGRP